MYELVRPLCLQQYHQLQRHPIFIHLPWTQFFSPQAYLPGGIMCEFIQVYFHGCHHILKFKIQICAEYILAYHDDLNEPTIPRTSAENLRHASVTCGRLTNRGETSAPQNPYDSVLTENSRGELAKIVADHMYGYYAEPVPGLRAPNPSAQNHTILAMMLRAPQHSGQCPANREEVVDEWEAEGICGINFRFSCDHSADRPHRQTNHFVKFQKFASSLLNTPRDPSIALAEPCTECGGTGIWNGVHIESACRRQAS
ncbi:hypothetical protein DFH27DRAFT_645429 [Peziza echinospora]|nr:hypothetical protein DFH27DRAFT_645429 [Peziza echinospora]